MPPELTPTRQLLLSLILRLDSKATVTRLAQEMKISKAAISRHVGLLRDLGLVAEDRDRYSPLRLTSKARRELGIGIPIYGEIAAGQPTWAESPEEYTPDFETLLGKREDDFLLRVRGDSMTGIGIVDGDFVLIRPTRQVDDGEVAVVTFPGENTATLKRVTVFVDTIYLDSANPDFPRMSFPVEEVQIQGRLIGKIGLYSHWRN